MTETQLDAFALGQQEAARAADATDMTLLYWRALPILKRELPTSFEIADVRAILVAHGLIANDKTEELRGFGAWPKRMGATANGYQHTKNRRCHGALRTVWLWKREAR